MLFALLAGILYAITGLIQIVAGFGLEIGLTDALFIPADIFGGFILLVIGSVFLFGVKELNEGLNEGVAYVYVGIILALVFAGIYVLVIGANALEAYVILSDDFEGWTPLDDMKPGIYIAIIPLIAYFSWKSKMSLARGYLDE